MGGAGFSLINTEAAVIVLGGTVVASGLACGWANLARAGQHALSLLRAPLDEAANRAALARLVYEIDRKGRFAAEAPLPPDPVLAVAVAAYLRLGELAPLHEARQTHRAAARTRRNMAVATWRQAGELAPVAGLAGTLYGIAQLAPGTGEGALALNTAAAIATAAVSTLYGLLLAHLVCLPLAGAIARRAQGEQAVRIRLVTWFESQLPAAPARNARCAGGGSVMIGKTAVRHNSWHFILADLALILFLLTLTALPVDAEVPGMRRKEARAAPDPQIAPAQALFRPVAGGPSLAAWLAGQPRDARATLTIFARYPSGGEAAAWQAAAALAREAAVSGVAVRTIIARGAEADLYASLAYDAPGEPAL